MIAPVVRCNGKRGGGDGDEDGDGLTHIQGAPVTGLETLCGFGSVQGAEYCPPGTRVECRTCKAIYDYVRGLSGVQWATSNNRRRK